MNVNKVSINYKLSHFLVYILYRLSEKYLI